MIKNTNAIVISELIDKAHRAAKRRGFWEPAPSFPANIALIHSELSEALEEDRCGRTYLYYNKNHPKPEGAAVELADAVIRICDLCGRLDIDLENAIKLKMAYNETRPHKHGKRY